MIRSRLRVSGSARRTANPQAEEGRGRTMEHRLRVYNTLTRQKEPFNPVAAGNVGMYVCGPTVYKPSHIGHMVGPVIFDTVKRYLKYIGYKVTWIVNITDVDDKLIVRARELGTTVKELAERSEERRVGKEGRTEGGQ